MNVTLPDPPVCLHSPLSFNEMFNTSRLTSVCAVWVGRDTIMYLHFISFFHLETLEGH